MQTGIIDDVEIERERTLMDEAEGESAATALRIWSVKEALAKALNIDLAQAWSDVEVRSSSPRATSFRIAGGAEHTAHHAILEGHLFTLVVLNIAVE